MAVVLISAALLTPSFSDPGPGMDEGILVAYPTLVQQGEVPGRDFETFYGPGVPYLGAAAFAVFGAHVSTERSIGFIFRIVIIGAVFALLLYWGPVAAVIGSLVTALILTPLGVAAISWFGAVALALLGLALTAKTAFGEDPRSRRGLLIAAGTVSGLALAFRPDIAPAVLVAPIPLLAGTGRIRRFGLWFLVGALPTVAWLAVVGPHDLHRVLSDLSASRSARQLPLPSVHSLNGEVLIAMACSTAALLAVGIIRLLRKRFDKAARLCLAFGVFSIALFPTALERADVPHLFASASVVVGLSPAAALELWRSSPRLVVSPKIAAVVVSIPIVVAVIQVARTVMPEVLGPRAPTYEVLNDGRSFPIGSQRVAQGLNLLLRTLDSVASPDARVFVGPVNLRLTNYNDSFIYYLLPHLRPASFYTELNGEAANASGSGLANDLRHADYLLLTTRYDNDHEPNASQTPGSEAPVTVVRDDFCLVAQAASYRLLRHCRRD